MENNPRCACGASGCNGSSNAFFELPQETRSRVEDLLIVTRGRLDLGTVERNADSEDIAVKLVSQEKSDLSVKLLSRSAMSESSKAEALVKICFYKETVLEQLRPTAPLFNGKEEEKLPALAEEIALKVESLGYVYSHASRSASLDTVPGFLTTYTHLHFVCGGEQQCRIDSNLVELEIIYEARRLSKAEAGMEPIGPCGFGC